MNSNQLFYYFSLAVLLVALLDVTSPAGIIFPGKQQQDDLNYDLSSSTSCNIPIENQGKCKSDYIFVLTAALEYSNCIRNNVTKTPLSKQQVLSCLDGDNYKCSATCAKCNPMILAKIFHTEKLYFTSEALFPYEAQDGKYQAGHFNPDCQNQDNSKCYPIEIVRNNLCDRLKYKDRSDAFGKFAGIARTVYLTRPREVDLLESIKQYGYSIVSVHANLESLANHKSGVYTDKNCGGGEIVESSVNMVGWGVEKTTKYWIVRNSRGTEWAQNGYIWIERGSNRCRIEEYAFFVEAEKVPDLPRLIEVGKDE